MGNNSNINQEPKIKNPGNGRELFYVVITIAIFIVMAVGATFAFFTATARSGDSAIGTRSTTLSLEYISYGTAWSKNDLIPSKRIVSEYSIEYQNDITLGNNTLLGNTLPETKGAVDKLNNTLCKDDYGNSVCSVYEFQVRNPANSPQTVSLNLISEQNEFASLNAMAYELTIQDATAYNNIANKQTAGNNGYGDPVFKTSAEDVTANAISVTIQDGESSDEVYTETPIYINRTGVRKQLLTFLDEENSTEGNPVYSPSINRPVPTVYEGQINLADNLEIAGGQTRTFIIVLYVLENEQDQTSSDANKGFTGRVLVSTGDGTTGVSGTISAAGGTEVLQGGNTEVTPTPATPQEP